MKRAAAVFLLLGFAWASCGALDVSMVVRKVLQEDPAVRIAGEAVDIAYGAFNRARADILPQLSLTSDYSLLYKPELHTPNPLPPPAEVATENYGSHTLSAGLSYFQVLPTSGSLSVLLSHDLDAITAKGEDGEYSQSPLLTVSVDQPVFFNGKLIDMALLPNSIRRERIGYLKAEEGDRDTRNSAVSLALDLFFNVVLLRKRIELAEKVLVLRQDSMGRVEKNLELGLASETDVWAARILVGKQREILLDMRISLLQSEVVLKQSLGMSADAELEPVTEVPELAIASGEDLLQSALAGNPGLREKRLSLEQEDLGIDASGIGYAPSFRASLSLFPSYPVVRTDTTLAGSVSDYFEEGAGLNYRLSLGLSVPLYNGSKAAHEREMSLAARRLAAQELAMQESRVIRELEFLLLGVSNLEEKIVLLRDNVELLRRRAEIEERLLALGKATDTDVSSAEIDLASKEIDLWNAESELFRNVLNIHVLLGEDVATILLER